MQSEIRDLARSGAFRKRIKAKERQRTPSDPEVPNIESSPAAAQQCSMKETDETQQRRIQEAVDATANGLSQRSVIREANLDVKLEMSRQCVMMMMIDTIQIRGPTMLRRGSWHC